MTNAAREQNQTLVLYTFLRIFTFSFYTHNVCTIYIRQKNRWTLDTAALTCFRTLYPRIQRGHWRYFGTPRLTKAAWIIPGGERNTAGDALEFVTDWEKGLTVLLYRVFCSLMSNPWKIRWIRELSHIFSSMTLDACGRDWRPSVPLEITPLPRWEQIHCWPKS